VTGSEQQGETEARARAWLHATHLATCDVIEPWAHGTVARSSRHPRYFDFNVVRVEDDPGMSVEELTSFADGVLAGLAHRRVDFELAAAAEPLRADFEAAGWKTTCMIWMRHGRRPEITSDARVEEVPYDAVRELRFAWHEHDFPGQDATGYHAQSREVALRRGARVLAAHEAGLPVAFTQLERDGAAAEITHVYVDPAHRGRGLGVAIVSAAIDAAGEVEDLWIAADDEDWPKQLYARLGFRPTWKAIEFLRPP
jgi:GNAT superfamily N-acetyltransferase